MSHRCCIVLIVSLRNYYFCWEKYSKIHDEEKLYVFPETNKKENQLSKGNLKRRIVLFFHTYTLQCLLLYWMMMIINKTPAVV